MKSIKYILFFATLILTSCTDVIDVDVPVAAPRLVIEASIDWEKGTLGNEQTILLSTSTPYFDSETIAIATGASVKITNDNDGQEFVFVDQNNGAYTNSNFVPKLNENYTLEVLHNGESYIAKETMTSVTDIVDIYQSRDNGFDIEALEVNVVFDDPAGIDNYYLFKFQRVGDLLPTLYDLSDEFTDGNEITMFYEKFEDEDTNEKELEPGDIVDIQFYGISEQYYNFISLLITQNEAGGPFGTTPVALRGNCINPTNPDNYAFGYFRLSQVVIADYTFE